MKSIIRYGRNDSPADCSAHRRRTFMESDENTIFTEMKRKQDGAFAGEAYMSARQRKRWRTGS